MTIKDETGKKTLPLKTVIRESIRYLKEHALKSCSLTENDVRWVLTVPTICSDSQKEFMRSAAIEVTCFFSVAFRFSSNCLIYDRHILIFEIKISYDLYSKQNLFGYPHSNVVVLERDLKKTSITVKRTFKHTFD